MIDLKSWHGYLHWSHGCDIETSEPAGSTVSEPGCWILKNSDAGITVVGKMVLIIRPCFATAIPEWERAISCRRACIRAGNPRVLLLIGCDYSSLAIDKLCDEAAGGNAYVVCFYFDFASRNEQSPVNMLGSLLRQLVSGQGKIPQAIVQEFEKEKSVIGGRGLQVSGILKMFQALTDTRRTFICIDALDECVPENRMVVLESLGQILQGSPDTRIFMTGRPQVRSEVERELGGAATFILIRATEDGVLRFLSEKLKRDTIPNMMSSTLKGDIMKSIPAVSSETYVGVTPRAKLP